jgi:hypothetical protein
MKTSLLTAVAAVAVIAGAGFVSAAEGAKDQPAAKPGAAEMHKGADVKGNTGMRGRPETSGAGSGMDSNSKAGAEGATRRGAPSATGSDAADANRNGAGTDKSKAGKDRSTTGASDRDRAGSQAGPSTTDRKSMSDQKSTKGQRSSDRKHNSTTDGSARGGEQSDGSASLTSEQRTKIRTTVLGSKNAPKLSRNDIHFDIHVGTVVPRTVRIVTVPETIVGIHPAWRGYRYFVVGDEVIIVEPRSLRIVAVLPA